MGKFIILANFLAFVLILSSNASVYAVNMPPQTNQVIKKLEEESRETLQINWNQETKTPSLLTGKLSSPSKHSPEWIAYEFLIKAKALYGIKNPHRDMKVQKIDRNHSDKIQVHLQHILFYTPVWGDTMMIEMDKQGVISQVKSTIHPNLEKKLLNRSIHAALSKKEAIDRVIASTKIKSTKSVDASKLEAQPYYLPMNQSVALVYAVNVHHTDILFVHALSGRIIHQTN